MEQLRLSRLGIRAGRDPFDPISFRRSGLWISAIAGKGVIDEYDLLVAVDINAAASVAVNGVANHIMGTTFTVGKKDSVPTIAIDHVIDQQGFCIARTDQYPTNTLGCPIAENAVAFQMNTNVAFPVSGQHDGLPRRIRYGQATERDEFGRLNLDNIAAPTGLTGTAKQHAARRVLWIGFNDDAVGFAGTGRIIFTLDSHLLRVGPGLDTDCVRRLCSVYRRLNGRITGRLAVTRWAGVTNVACRAHCLGKERLHKKEET